MNTYTDSLPLPSSPNAISPSYYYVDDIPTTYNIESLNINMPNVSTPDGNNINDSFKPKEFTDITDSELRIYNRWGCLIFVTSDFNKGWDGNNFN